MHNLELAALIVLAVTLVLRVLARSGRPADDRGAAALLAVGALTGVLGALVVLTQSEDLVPDQLEAAVSPFVVVLVTVALLALARRPSPGH